MQNYRIWVITLFPEFFLPLTSCGVVGNIFIKADDPKEHARVSLQLVPLRHFSENKYQSVDDIPYGGGPGMIIRADVLKRALLDGVVSAGGYGEDYRSKLHIIYTGPRGKKWDQHQARNYAQTFFSTGASKDLVFICGRYEGIDERFIERYVDEEISVGDYVLSGGEPAIMVILDSTLRLMDGVLGNNQSLDCESFNNDLLDYPQYTRPREFDGAPIPQVLTSGNHQEINKYRKSESRRITEKYRPDLLDKESLGSEKK